MTSSNEVQVRHLEHLSDVELQYRQDLKPVTPPDGKIGQYIGSGDGTISGPKFQGTVRWDLYEDIGERVCQTNFAGNIDTQDNARIQFEAKGFGMVPDPSKPNDWVMSYVVRFDTADSRYAWLNKVLALWDGQFSAETYLHHYRAYIGTSQ
jgi:hypothetical protein